jgi:hypothetical protein
MKVIGKTDSSYLVEITERELSQVMGYGSEYSLPAPHKDRRAYEKFTVGSVVNVSELFAAVEIERGRVKKIAAQAKALRGLADEIDSVNTKLASALTEVSKPE